MRDRGRQKGRWRERGRERNGERMQEKEEKRGREGYTGREIVGIRRDEDGWEREGEEG